MPLYEYTCRDCGTSFEKRLRIDERLAPQECPSCHASRSALRMSAPSFVGAATGGSDGVPRCPSTGHACGCGHGVLN
jgi:putative FmdB family regulatory protein